MEAPTLWEKPVRRARRAKSNRVALQRREFKNTQSPRLRFRALLTGSGDPRLQLHRA
jgi:hypothetical protein